MEKKIQGLMPTCKEVHRLVSEAMDRDLPLTQRLRVRLHLLICTACSRFERQMALLRSALRSFPMDAVPGNKEKK
jgi:hypothetical protein